MIIEKEKYIWALINAIDSKGIMEIKKIEIMIEHHLSIAESIIKEQESYEYNRRIEKR